MKVVYFIFAVGLAITFLAFAQRLYYWICKCIEGKQVIKHIRPSNRRYRANMALYKRAKIEAACWALNAFIIFYLYIDCVQHIFRG